MNDTKTLLENAAKAMGYTWSTHKQSRRLNLTPPLYDLWITTEGEGSTAWNPTENSADCFEMECKLKIVVTYGKSTLVSSHAGINVVEHFDADIESARRKASTTVAAMIGLAKPD